MRAYAEARVDDEDDDDGRWAKVKTLSDEQIWKVIQWCDYEQGAINIMSRAAKTMRVDKPDVEPAGLPS